MGALRRTLLAIALAWSALSAMAALLAAIWLRERYGRGGPFPARDALSLLNPGRRWLHPVAETVRFFHIEQGDTVLELGPGPGYFTAEASRAAGASGRVVCADVQAGMIAVLDARLRRAHVANACPVIGDATRLPLADASIDAAFLVFVLGEIPDRPAAMAELRRVIKCGGTLSIMETLTDSDYQLEAPVQDLCRAYGFRSVERRRQRFGYARRFEARPTA